MNFPNELKYTKDHEWIRVEGDEAVIGITDFAQRELGDIVFVDVDTIGEEVGQDEVFGTIEAVKTVSDLFNPVAYWRSIPKLTVLPSWSIRTPTERAG